MTEPDLTLGIVGALRSRKWAKALATLPKRERDPLLNYTRPSKRGGPRPVQIWQAPEDGHVCAIFTGRAGRTGYAEGGPVFFAREMSRDPFAPQGVGVSFEMPNPLAWGRKWPAGDLRKALGSRIGWAELTPRQRQSVLQDFAELYLRPRAGELLLRAAGLRSGKPGGRKP